MNVNVSVWMMILWLVNCYLVISSLFAKPRQFKVESDDKNEDSDEVAVVTAIIALVVGIVFIAISIWYLGAAASTVNNTLFTFFSAALIIATIVKIPKVLELCGKVINKEAIEPTKKGLSALILIKILHLVYFGYYIFTGISLFEVILK